MSYLVTTFESATTAEAGDDRTVTDTDNDGIELVVLDGTTSTCTDGTITTYVWTEQGALLGLSPVMPVALPPGEHTIALTVTTDYGAKSIDTITITVEPAAKPGDADGDGEVGIPDFVILKNSFGLSPATWSQGDFDGDGTVGIEDFVILKNNFGS